MNTLEELEAIRARHEAWDRASECNDATKQCHTDRATLLRLLDAARAELAEVREAAGPFVKLAKHHGYDKWDWLDEASPHVHGGVPCLAYYRLAAALKDLPTPHQTEQKT